MNSRWSTLSFALVAIFALSGCGGGGGGGGGGSTTTNQISRVVPNGSPIPVGVNTPWYAQYLNGHRIVNGVFNGVPGMYLDNTFKAMPLTIPGATNYVPLFMAGKIVYGTYSGGNFSWNVSSNSVASTGSKVATAVSPDGNYVAFETAGTGSVLNVSTNTEIAIPVSAIQAISDGGSGVCVAGSGNSSIYRFGSNGALAKNPLSGGENGQSFSIQAVNPNGLLAGQYGDLPGIWPSNSGNPSPLGIPGGNVGFAWSMNVGGAVGGWYQASAGSESYALLWPNASRTPNVFVDVNGQFPLAGGAVLNGIYALDPASLNFIGLVTNANGSQSLQAFSVN